MRRVRLTKKLAAVMNGIDVSSLNVGDLLELPDSAAHMMIAEGWAEPAESVPLTFAAPPPQAVAG